jgi:hypothetical protein
LAAATRRRRGGAFLAVVLVVLAAVLVVALLVADVTARTLAEDALAARVKAAVPSASTTSAQVRSFPFLGRLLTSGRVPEVDAAVGDITVQGLRFASIAVALHGVQVDRDQLLRDRRVVLEKIDRGRVEARVTADALTEALGVPITLEQGRASVTIAGHTLGAELSVENGRLVVGVAGFSLPTIHVTAPLLPCVANARIDPGVVLLTCDFTEIPAELRTPAQL